MFFLRLLNEINNPILKIDFKLKKNIELYKINFKTIPYLN